MRFTFVLSIFLTFICGLAHASEDNAVRDDIAIYIDQHYPNAPLQSAVGQLARTLQQAMEVDTDDKNAVRAVSALSSRAINCLYLRYDQRPEGKHPAAIVSELEALTANTPALRKQYAAYNRALSGSVSTLPDGNTCDDEAAINRKPD